MISFKVSIVCLCIFLEVNNVIGGGKTFVTLGDKQWLKHSSMNANSFSSHARNSNHWDGKSSSHGMNWEGSKPESKWDNHDSNSHHRKLTENGKNVRHGDVDKTIAEEENHDHNLLDLKLKAGVHLDELLKGGPNIKLDTEAKVKSPGGHHQ